MRGGVPTGGCLGADEEAEGDFTGGAGRGRRELVVWGGEASTVFKRKRGETEPSSTPVPTEEVVFVLFLVIGGERMGGGRPSTGTGGGGACWREAAAERAEEDMKEEEEEDVVVEEE